MYMLFYDANASESDATYLFCRNICPVTYQWRTDLTNIEQVTAHYINDSTHESFDTLHTLLDFYRKRDSADFKLLGRGNSILHIFERYPELLI